MFLLRGVDLFKANPETRFKGQRGGHSFLFGRTLTIFIISMSIALLIYFSLNMLTKSNPQIETFNAISTGNLILNNDTFPFAFAMRDINSTFYVDENIYTVGAYFASSLKNITLTMCKPTAFPGVYDPETQIAIYCFSDQQEFVDEIEINGAGGLVINFYKCDNNTNPNCRNESEIDEIVYNSRLRILYHTVSISPNDYENPMSDIITAWDPSVARTVVKENAMYLSQNYFISDSGWLFSNPKNTSKIIYDDRLQYFEDNSIMGNVFNVIYVRTYGQIRYTYRTYDSLQTILPRWNAMFTLLIVFGKIISVSYNQFKTRETLVQDIFFVKNKKARREKTKSSIKSSLQLGSQSLFEIKKQAPSSLASRRQTYKEDSPLRSMKDSPVIALKKTKSVEINTSGYQVRALDEPKLADENEPLKKSTQEKSQIYQKTANRRLSMDALPLPLPYQNAIEHNQEINSQKAFQIKLNSLDIGIDNTDNIKQDSSSPNRCNSQDLEAANSPKPPKIQKQRTERSLFHEESDVGFCTWLVSSLRKTEQYKVHLKRESIIQEEFDFQNYAKRFIGIDVLKYLLLSKDQLKVFDNCVKAYVNLKLDALTKGSATDNDMFNELRTMFNSKGFPAEVEDDALVRLREIPDPDEVTKKALYLLEVLDERET